MADKKVVAINSLLTNLFRGLDVSLGKGGFGVSYCVVSRIGCVAVRLHVVEREAEDLLEECRWVQGVCHDDGCCWKHMYTCYPSIRQTSSTWMSR
jgi:hypothetical protein